MRFRVIKWVSLGLGAIVALALIAVLVIVWFVDANRFKPAIESAVRDATGRTFTLVGDIELGFFPRIGLRTGEGRFGNAPGFGPDPMVSWRRAQLGAQLFPLLRGRLVADRVILEGAEVRLLRRADGSNNWQDIGSQEPAAKPDGEAMEFHIDGIEISDSRMSFVDESVPRRIEVASLNLSTDEIALGEPFTDTEISGVLHMDGFATEGLPFRVAVPRVEAPKDFSAIDVEEYSLMLGGFEAEGSAKGTLGNAPKISGAIESNEFDPRALLTTLGIATPATTDPSALSKLRFAATWGFDAGAILVDPFTLRVDDTSFSGNFRQPAGEGAVGEFLLRGDSLDIARYIPPEDPDSEPFVLPTAMLKSLRYRGALELEQAKLDDIEMKGVTLRLVIDENGVRGAAPEAPK